MSKRCKVSALNLPEKPKFTGCNGDPWSDEFLEWHLQRAVESESYEWAQECFEEKKRRNSLKHYPRPSLVQPRCLLKSE